MKKRFMCSVTQFLLVLAMVGSAMSLPNVRLVGATPVPSVFVDPMHSTANVSSSFDVRVNVSNAAGVTGYGVTIQFNQALLVVTGWRSGGFLESSGIATLGPFPNNQSDLGYVGIEDYLSRQGSASGNGSLVILSFKVIANGNCALHIYDTQLTDQNNNLIDHTETDGSFTTPSTQESPLLQVLIIVMIIVVVAIVLVALAYGMKRAKSGKTSIRRATQAKSNKKMQPRQD